MRILAGLLACGVLVCTTPARADYERPDGLAVTGLVLAQASLAADLLTTLDIKNHWQVKGAYNLQESNPLLGAHPSDLKVLGYFALAAGGTVVLFRELPNSWRPYAMAAILGLEAWCVVGNLSRAAGTPQGFRLTLPF